MIWYRGACALIRCRLQAAQQSEANRLKQFNTLTACPINFLLCTQRTDKSKSSMSFSTANFELSHDSNHIKQAELNDWKSLLFYLQGI